MTREHDEDRDALEELEGEAFEGHLESEDVLAEPEPPTEEERPWGAPAPVVTDEGVYGTLPPRRPSFDEYQRESRPRRNTGLRLAGTALAVAAGLWLLVFSASQASSETVARPALESLLDTMVGLPELLELHHDEIAEVSGDATVPGYPLAITIPAEEVAAGPEHWREVLLEQSSALLYQEGPSALSSGEDTGGGGTFSTSGGVKLLMSNLTESRHASLAFLVWPLGLAAIVAAIAVIALGPSFSRFVTLGVSTAVAGFPAIGLGILSWLIVTFVGSDGSALADTAHSIASDLAWSPLRNGLTFVVTGLVVAVLARLLASVFRAPAAASRRREAYEDYE